MKQYTENNAQFDAICLSLHSIQCWYCCVDYLRMVLTIYWFKYVIEFTVWIKKNTTRNTTFLWEYKANFAYMVRFTNNLEFCKYTFAIRCRGWLVFVSFSCFSIRLFQFIQNKSLSNIHQIGTHTNTQQTR